eukprot:UN03205
MLFVTTLPSLVRMIPQIANGMDTIDANWQKSLVKTAQSFLHASNYQPQLVVIKTIKDTTGSDNPKTQYYKEYSAKNVQTSQTVKLFVAIGYSCPAEVQPTAT